MTRTVLIVEDEPLAADTLREYLRQEDDFECVGEVRSGPDAVDALARLEPDVLLLDVELPGASGVEVLLRSEQDPAVIFTTAYDQHAVTAFELGAFDYLVKPFGQKRFAEALDRVRDRLDAATDRVEEPSASHRVRTALSERGGLQRLFVQSAGAIVPVEVDDILRLEASGDYVRVHVEDDSYLVSLPLAEFERRLDPDRFLRIHRSHVVNADHIDRVEKHDRRRLRVHLDDGTSVVASRSGSRDLRDRTV